MKKIDINDYLYNGKGTFNLAKSPTKIKDVYEDKAEYEAQMAEYAKILDEQQSMMYAHNRYGVLVIFQAMDAAGKDSAIKSVMSGINPHGVRVFEFKRPSDTELDHDFLWRTQLCMPERGRIHVFNRSYYEEVLVVKVHPEILTQYQRLPESLTKDTDKVWKNRYEDITNYEKFLVNNGTHIVKIFLNISKKEQAARFLERLEEPSKNWKFAEADLKEREKWDDYMNAYQTAINETATEKSPWYVVPGDDKKNARLIIAEILHQELKKLHIAYPTIDEARAEELSKYKEFLMNEIKK